MKPAPLTVMKQVLMLKWQSNANVRVMLASFNVDYNSIVKVDQDSVSHGYDALETQGNIIALYKDGKAVDALPGDLIVLDQTRMRLKRWSGG